MSHRSRRALGKVLIGLGIVILVAVGGWLVWNRSQSATLRTQLSLTPGAAPEVSASATPLAAESPAPPTAFPTETPSPVPLPTQPEPTVSPVMLSATAEPAAAPEPLAPTATSIRMAVATVTPSPAPTATSVISSAPVRVAIPDLKLDVPVVEMGWRVVQTADGPRSDWVIPKAEAGHHINSALLGEPGNLVISGHNNIFGQVFKPISFAWDSASRTQVDSFTDRSDLLTGRALQLFDATGQQYDYVIQDFYRLKDTGVSAQQRIVNARFIEPTEQAQVTIITCWPPTSNTHRLVLIAVPAN